LLCNDRETGGYTAISGQRLGKLVPVPRQQILISQQLGYKRMEEPCFLHGLCWDAVSKGQGQLFISVHKSMKKGFEPGGKGIAIVGAVTHTSLL
jgi:hypothetical protein